MSDLFGNHIVGFPTRWLKWLLLKIISCDMGIYAIIGFSLPFSIQASYFIICHFSPFKGSVVA